MRFLSLASVPGADQTVARFAASELRSVANREDGCGVEPSCAAILVSISLTRVSARFQRDSSSAVTSRFSGSAASYCRKAPIGAVARRLQIAHQCGASLVMTSVRPGFGLNRQGNCSWLDDPQERLFDGVIDA